jgi:hypothetical protein
MKTRAVSMVLLMIASALAGCASGDPDGDGDMGIDTDMLNDLIEDNLQDFINNTSVTVHQTIHYHNNTTYVVDDGDYRTTNNAHFNNTTNVDGGEINNYDQSNNSWNIGGGSGANGSLSGSIMQVYRIQDSAQYTTGDIGNSTFVLDGILQHPAIGISPDLIYTIGSTTISLTLTCNEFANAYNIMSTGDWQDWLHYERGLSWNAADQISHDIENDIYQLSDEAQTYCMFGQSQTSQTFKSEMLQIELSTGEAMQFVDITGYWYWNISCDDGYFASGGVYNVDSNELLGGWEDCIFTIYQSFTGRMDWEYIYLGGSSSNTSSINIPNWHDYAGSDQWFYLNSDSGISEHDSIIYFTKYFVVPVE